MRKLIAALLLTTATPAFAQAWGPDGAQPVVYATATGGTYTEVLGDGSNARGGTAPAIATQPAKIATTGITVADWMDTPGDGDRVPLVGNGENKFRITCNATHEKTEDPIVFYGQANAGHEHTFVGNSAIDKDSTYTTLRGATGTFACNGAALNKTAYWEPSVKKTLASGRVVTIKPDQHTFYYVVNSVDSAQKTELIRGLAFIGGMNPADMTNSARLAEIPTGLATSGNWGVLGSGYRGVLCVTTGGTPVQTATAEDYSPALQTAGGGDPWAGACTAGHQLAFIVAAPGCWDGHNATSPNGRDHFRYALRHPNSGQEDICPNGWFEVPTFEAKALYSHNGWSDYSTWYLSSDRMDSNPANWLRPGSSFHFDWMNGWDPDVLESFETKCLGIVVVGGPSLDPAACATGTISATQRLKSGTPPVGGWSNTPIINPTQTYYNQADKLRYFPLRAGTRGPFVIHNHGN